MIEISFLIWDPMDCFWMRSLSSTLMATASCVSTLTACFTLPKVPSPNVRPISYLPTCFFAADMVASRVAPPEGPDARRGPRLLAALAGWTALAFPAVRLW